MRFKPTVFPRALRVPVVVGAVTGVRVVVAATGSPPTRYPAGVNAALAYEPERLQFRLERVVLLLIAAQRCAVGHRFVVSHPWCLLIYSSMQEWSIKQTMNCLRGSFAPYWQSIQRALFPQLELVLGPLTGKQQQLVQTLEVIRIEQWIPRCFRVPGRPRKDRAALARAFVAKAVYDMPTTRVLLDRLVTDVALRRICGWERKSEVPSESVFSRAFAELSDTQLPQRTHAALIRNTHHDRLVGHLCRDSTAIEAREKPAAKEKTPPLPKRKRGRPNKGEERPKVLKRLDRQAAMTLPAMLDDLPTDCDVGMKKDSKGYKSTWVGYKLHLDVADGQIPISCLLTSASLHDSQAAIPLATLSAERTTNLYDLMDAAYDAEPIPPAQPLTRPRPVD